TIECLSQCLPNEKVIIHQQYAYRPPVLTVICRLLRTMRNDICRHMDLLWAEQLLLTEIRIADDGTTFEATNLARSFAASRENIRDDALMFTARFPSGNPALRVCALHDLHFNRCLTCLHMDRIVILRHT